MLKTIAKKEKGGLRAALLSIKKPNCHAHKFVATACERASSLVTLDSRLRGNDKGRYFGGNALVK